MDTLHAPWRIQYIAAPKRPASSQSIFYEIGQSNDDEANYVICREKSCYAVLNSHPYTGGHLMTVPYKQVATLDELTDNEMLELFKLTRRCQTALKKVMNPHGFNIGINLGKAAGAGIAEHLHVHVVPRWDGDTNFMPVIAGATVVPEALKDTAAKLRAALAS